MNDPIQYYNDNRNILTMEAIKWQGTALFDGIAALLEHESKKTSREVTNEPIAGGLLDKLVFKETGINCFFTAMAQEAPGSMKNYNAAIYTPSISRNNVLNNGQDFLFGSTDRDGKSLIRNAKELQGLVDLVKGRVGGVFSKIRLSSYITVDMLLDTDLFTASEKAAIILHEIGHAFTWFEALVFTARMNMCLKAINDTLRDNSDERIRVTLADGVAETMNVKLDSKDLATTDNPDIWYTVFIKAVIEERRNAANSGRYTDISSEFLADQFSTRHGAGKELATGLYKMHKYYNARALRDAKDIRREYIASVIWMGLKGTALAYITGPIWAMIISALLIWNGADSDDSTYNIYDNPKRRLEKIRNEMMDLLKSPNATADDKKMVAANISEIDTLLREYNNTPTFNAFLLKLFSSKERKLVKVRDVQNALEDLTNNDVFLVASKISTIGK